MQKYEYSVLTVCDTIHGKIVGSSDYPYDVEEFKKLGKWLKWRINNNWDANRNYYDWCVCQLAKATIEMYEKEFGEI